MLKLEEKIIEWINGHMIYIAFIIVLVTAVWIRLAGWEYVGNDYHFYLYDIPGNCNSLLYRSIVAFLMERSEFIVMLLKFFAYTGDFAVTFFTMVLWRRSHSHLNPVAALFLLTACLLSPVILLYSMGGMRIDSLCMSLILAGILCLRNKLYFPAVLLAAAAAFLYPVYWPVVLTPAIWIVIKQKRDGQMTIHMTAALFLLFCLLIVSVFLEDHGGDGIFFWGKLFVINPHTGEVYANPGQWLSGMLNLYGYCLATGSLLPAFSRRRMRIPALLLQLLILLYMGWQQTSALAI